MPGFDRKGPQGEGPLTGAGTGLCNSGRRRPQNDSRGVGRGGLPWGGGMGRCYGGGGGRRMQRFEKGLEGENAGLRQRIRDLEKEARRAARDNNIEGENT